ncbi:hypothetical protein D3C76_1172710 [compost metagenome]
MRESQLQRRQLQLRYRAVVHQLTTTRFGQQLLRRGLLPPFLRGLAELEILHHVDVDIHHVQPAARRRAIRAGAFRAGRIQRLDRVEPDKGAAAFPHLADHRPQIAKVANPPVTLGTQRVELYAGSPQLLAGQQGIRFEATLGGNNQPAGPLLLPL